MAILVFLVGLLLGGLVNFVAVRLPKEGEAGGWPPRCTRCGRPLAAWQLIPLLGWLAQGGRARCCRRSLDWVFPLVDLGAAAAVLVFYLREGLTVSFFYLTFVTLVLLLTAAIDWRHRMIYTLFVLLPAVLALVASAFVPQAASLSVCCRINRAPLALPSWASRCRPRRAMPITCRSASRHLQSIG